MASEALNGGFGRKLFHSGNPKGVWVSLGIALLLLGLNLVLQTTLGFAALKLILGSNEQLHGILLAMFPAALVVAFAAWQLAKLGGGNPADVLNLHWPRLGLSGFVLVICGFMVSVMALFVIVGVALSLFGFDPKSGGMVENAMSGLSSEGWLYVLMLPSIIFGAPIAEEIVFRGQLFSALTKTRAGFSGAAVITSLGWALLHYTGNWLLVTFIFIMGLVLSYMLYRFGSLWVTIACHASWNAMSSLLIFSGFAP